MVLDRIEREILVHAPPARVWAALTEARHLGRWFGDAGAEVDLRPGGMLVCRWKEHGTAHGIIERVEANRLLSFRWSLVDGERPRDGNATRVTFTLAPEADGTRLKVVETGFEHLDGTDEDREAHLRANRSGWVAELSELEAYLAPGAA